MSKFPALEDIDDEIAPSTVTPAADNDDEFVDFSSAGGANDFLSREKALLGDDAKEFATEEDSKIKGDEDEIDQFKSSFPEINGAAEVAASAPQEDSEPEQLSSNVNKLSLEDSPAIREWRERQSLQIQERDRISEQKRQETREAAKRAIDDFYDNYADKKEKQIEKVRAEEKKFLEERDNSVVGTTWDRIAKLIDTSKTGSKSELHDKTRFKEVILSLKGNPDAPGAAGY